MFGVNKDLIVYMVKDKLNEIINGNYPEGFELKEKTPEKTVLKVSEFFSDEELTPEKIDISFKFKNHLIVLTNE